MAENARLNLVLVNSHDRSSACQLPTGLFRFVCGNGMIILEHRLALLLNGFRQTVPSHSASHFTAVAFQSYISQNGRASIEKLIH